MASTTRPSSLTSTSCVSTRPPSSVSTLAASSFFSARRPQIDDVAAGASDPLSKSEPDPSVPPADQDYPTP